MFFKRIEFKNDKRCHVTTGKLIQEMTVHNTLYLYSQLFFSILSKTLNQCAIVEFMNSVITGICKNIGLNWTYVGFRLDEDHEDSN